MRAFMCTCTCIYVVCGTYMYCFVAFERSIEHAQCMKSGSTHVATERLKQVLLDLLGNKQLAEELAQCQVKLSLLFASSWTT